ncbi:MAG: S9 family peptidase [Capsulimonadales bacterium]|nr:S9 family peptidase [Capsulimonadales bacterium]
MTAEPIPPVATKRPRVFTIHGRELKDDYFWLREKTNPEVLEYLKAENAYQERIMQPTKDLQERLYREMLGRIKETDENVPYRQGAFFYYTRTEEGKSYPIHCRKAGDPNAPEQVVLDLNEIGKDKPFTALGAYSPSDDGRFLVYSIDHSGFREYYGRIRDLTTGEDLPDDLGKITFAFFAGDNETVFYGVEDAAKRPYRVCRHRLGQPKESDIPVYEEADELYRAYAYRTRSKQFIIFLSASSVTTEASFLTDDAPESAPKLLFPRRTEIEYYPDHHGESFYLRINDRGRNFRLVTVPTSEPDLSKAVEILPHRPETLLERVDLFRDFLICSEREGGLPRLRITELASGDTHYPAFPEPAYSASVGVNPEFDTSTLRYVYQSLVTPSSVYDYDLRTRVAELKKRQEIPSGYDPSGLRSERIVATAADGTKIPISLVYKEGLVRDGSAPLHLIAYGSYGFSYPITFSTNRLSLIERGITVAIAHIRGGAEMGKAWHDQGKMMNKKNTFTDFIACAEHLIAEKYTSSDRLTIQGGSAGGLLMGAVVNLRPDLFRAVISDVPFVDVINTMLDATLPLTVQEYLEWGNPNEPAAFEYMLSYSPYDNLEAKDYPAILITTSLNDSQVMYWEPAKYTAKLRTLKTDPNLLLLKTNMDAGHGGASGRYDALREIAFEYAFLLAQLGKAEE